MVVDIENRLSDINSSRRDCRANKDHLTMNIGRGKISRTRRDRFREVRAMVRRKLRDARNGIRSQTGYVARRMTRIKDTKIMDLLCKGERMDDGKWDVMSGRVDVFILLDDGMM